MIVWSASGLTAQWSRRSGLLAATRQAADVWPTAMMAHVRVMDISLPLLVSQLLTTYITVLYSAGLEGVIKQFSSATGVVQSKMSIPLLPSKQYDSPCAMHVLNPQKLVIACDSTLVYVVDLNDGILPKLHAKKMNPHADYVTAIIPLPPSTESTSGFSRQWVSTGGSTLAHIDVHTGEVVESEDQDDAILCGTFVPGLGPKKNKVGA